MTGTDPVRYTNPTRAPRIVFVDEYAFARPSTATARYVAEIMRAAQARGRAHRWQPEPTPADHHPRHGRHHAMTTNDDTPTRSTDNMLAYPDPHPTPNRVKAYPGFPAEDMYQPTQDIPCLRARYRLVEPMPADMLAALDTTPETEGTP